MTSSPHLHRVHEAGVVRSHIHPDDIEAWLDHIRPVFAALGAGAVPPTLSAGQRRWLHEHHQIAVEAVRALEDLLCDAEAGQAPVDDLQWLLTRVCALVDGLSRLGAPVDVAA